MINLINAIYDHATEQMEEIDETIQAYNDKIIALRRERDAIAALYDVAKQYREDAGSRYVPVLGQRSAVYNVPRPATLNAPLVNQLREIRQGRATSEGSIPTTAAAAVAENQSVQSSNLSHHIF